MLAILGAGVLLLTTIMLASQRILPIVAFVVIPIAAALLAGFTPLQILGHVQSGMKTTSPVAVMFVFAITFSGILRDAGLFRPLVSGLVRITGDQPVRIALATALVAMIAHIDGAGPTTFLITLPALLPLYQRVGMPRTLLMTLVALSAGVMNMLPWAGPLGRAASVAQLDVIELWRTLLPLQLLGIVAILCIAFVLGRAERNRLACAGSGQAAPCEDASTTDVALSRAAYPRFWPNLLLLLATLLALASGNVSSTSCFMIATIIALLLNHPRPAAQLRSLADQAPLALGLAMVILTAGSLLGILQGTGMLGALASRLAGATPPTLLPHLHELVGALGAPLNLLFGKDAYYFALLPLIIETAGQQGVPSRDVAIAMASGNIIGGYAGPFSPALWLGLSLAQVSLREHLKHCLPWATLLGLLLAASALLLGIT